MKYFIDGKHVKTAPKKYEVLDFFNYVTDLTKKRLNKEERDGLDLALRWHEIKDAMRFTREGQMTLRLIGDEKPVKAVRVNLRERKHYFVAVTDKKKEIKVDQNFFNTFPKKEYINRNY